MYVLHKVNKPLGMECTVCELLVDWADKYITSNKTEVYTCIHVYMYVCSMCVCVCAWMHGTQSC